MLSKWNRMIWNSVYVSNTNSTMINCSVKALGNKFIGNLIIRSYILSQYTCSNVVAYIYYTCKTFFKAVFFHLRKVFTLNDSMMLLIKLEPFPKNQNLKKRQGNLKQKHFTLYKTYRWKVFIRSPMVKFKDPSNVIMHNRHVDLFSILK